MNAKSHKKTKSNAEWFPGKRDVLVNIVNYRARKCPEALFAEYPISSTAYDDGYREINYADFANAVNGAASWMEEHLGRGRNFETLAYIGPNDIRYAALVLGAVKAGYKLLLLSPENSIAAYSNLLDLLNCKTMLVPDPQPPMISAVLTEHRLRVLAVLSVDYFLNHKHPYYPYKKRFENVGLELLLAFQTPGSTGLPWAIMWSRECAATYSSIAQIDPPSRHESYDRLMQPASPLVSLCSAITNRTALVYPLSGAVPNARLLADSLKYTKADVALISPRITTALGKDPKLLNFLSSRLKTLIVLGEPVPVESRNRVAKDIKFLCPYRSSELGYPPEIHSDADSIRQDWRYHHFHPGLGIEFQRVEGNLHELWMIRDRKLEERRPIFKLNPHVDAFESGDLFSPHPSHSNLWASRGRALDILSPTKPLSSPGWSPAVESPQEKMHQPLKMAEKTSHNKPAISKVVTVATDPSHQNPKPIVSLEEIRGGGKNHERAPKSNRPTSHRQSNS
ncbi:hypothetical protein G7Y89_g7043 [Cudoniella acicularis]|uniref:AMP-dependent synthetase/ligase domain-containing protein n=1 Tax=Cudoniella acicularis TaxID=354080 RepID=A0A8H4RJA1_9HELO|nr:hypothetical protein G7Y89_g7043 [Cudoniella acicularis]